MDIAQYYHVLCGFHVLCLHVYMIETEKDKAKPNTYMYQSSHFSKLPRVGFEATILSIL